MLSAASEPELKELVVGRVSHFRRHHATEEVNLSNVLL